MRKQTAKDVFAAELEAMLDEMPLSKVRVAELCRRVDAAVPTFYYHFQDKYDLVAWIFFHEAFKTDVLSLESAARSMNKMRSDFIFYKRAYEDTSQTPLWHYMVEYFADRYEREAMRALGQDVLDAQMRFSIRLYCHGTVGMTREWLLTDNITPAETIVQMMFDSMPERLSKTYFG